jgi:hypothetical protein
VRLDQNVRLSSTVIISNLAALKHVDLTIQPPSGVFLGSKDQCDAGDGVRIMVFIDVATTARLKLFDPEIFPLGDVLVSAQREGGGPSGPIDLGFGIDIAGNLLTGAVLEDLLGICLGAQYMLDVNAFALAQ